MTLFKPVGLDSRNVAQAWLVGCTLPGVLVLKII